MVSDSTITSADVQDGSIAGADVQDASLTGADVQDGSQDHYFAPELDRENFIKQAYEHLKTLPEFEGAEDC